MNARTYISMVCLTTTSEWFQGYFLPFGARTIATLTKYLTSSPYCILNPQGLGLFHTFHKANPLEQAIMTTI